MGDALKQARRTIQAHGLLGRGDGVVVGVSGGPDSLCLLHVLLCLREAHDLQLHVAHLHHGVRGADADADAEFVAALADEWGLCASIERQNVPALAREHRLAFEEAARRVRYAFLARVAGEVAARKIAVGHNADDQAETVLMHLLRGAGLAGLRGMLPATPIGEFRQIEPFLSRGVPDVQVIRPLLQVSRAEVERHCLAHGLAPRFDRSNLDTTYFRNRLRHELLPLLEAHGPNVRERLCHTADVVAADYDLLIRLREQAWAEVVCEEREAVVVFDRAAWRALPVALQRATLRQAAYRLRDTLRDVSYVHVENARRVALTGETGAEATLPMGLVLFVRYDMLVVGGSASTDLLPDTPLLWGGQALSVRLPGVTRLPESEWVLAADLLTGWDLERIAANPDPWAAWLDEEALGRPLALRTRRRGDRFRPHGMQGHSVRLSEFMTNCKIPRGWRDRVPLLVAGSEIVWVCGQRIGESAAVTPQTRRTARLSFERSAREGE